MNSSLRRLRIVVLVLVAGSLAVALTASAAPNAKRPIKIMVISSWDTPLVDLGDLPTIIRNTARYVNAQRSPKGRGIDGAKVLVVSCNDRADPNLAEACARRAVSERVVALIGGFSIWGNRIFPILEQAGIPWVGNFAFQPIDGVSRMSFPAAPGALINFAPSALAARSCKRTAIVANAAQWTAQKPWAEAGMKAENKRFVAQVLIPSTATDYAPFAAQLRAVSPDCLVNVLGEQQIFQLIPAMTAVSLKVRVYTVAGTALTQRIVDQFRRQTEGWVAVGYYPLHTQAVFREYQAILKRYPNLGKYAPNVGGSSELRSYIGFKIFQQVATKINGPVTNRSLVAALNTACDVRLGGMAPKFNFCKENPVPELRRIFNTSFTFQIVKNGKFRMLSRSFQNMLPNYLRSKK